MGEHGYAAAARNTLNAHYTDPALAAAMWAAVEAAGITEGTFVEPGCGRGTFLSLAPEAMRGLGVELDPATARIAQLLADPRHQVVNADFATLAVAPGRADVAIGNVPFSEVGLFDPTYNPDRKLSMHDHFLAKAAAMLAPGGLAILITSRYTLDAKSTAGRQAIGRYADFVGAVRLPSAAHQQEAGTSAVTDVVVLRGRASGAPPAHLPGFLDRSAEVAEWRGVPLMEPMALSPYYLAHPNQVLGEIQVATGPFGVQMRVAGRKDTAEELAAALTRLVTEAGIVPEPSAPERLPSMLLGVGRERSPVGRIERLPSGLFRQRGPESWVAHDPGTTRGELAVLVSLRDQARQLVDLEGAQESTEEVIEARRADLAATYRRYVEHYGPLNRVKVDPATDRRTYPRMGGFRRDPDWPRVAALEVYDEATGTAAPATMLERRVLHPVVVPEHVDDPADALSMSLQQRGRLDVEYLAQVTAQPAAEVLAALGDRVYLDPAHDQWVVAEEYLSGNVRVKLREAESAAADDHRFARNVEALTAVIPRDVTADELQGTLGAPWVPVTVVEEFARSLCPERYLRQDITVSHSTATGEWVIGASGAARQSMGRDHEFGGPSFDALTVLSAAVNGRSPVITKLGPNDARIVDADATTQAVEKSELLQEAFDAWLLKDDPVRSAEMLGRYNEQFNAYVPRSYSGITMRAPGLRSDFSLRPHQHQAIARIVFGRDALLAHAVGAGKTAELIVGAMERRRLGMCALPAFVVPNHMLEQFSTDIADLYPAAEILVIDREDISPTKRAMFAARVQSHEWDAVVITHSSFGRWGVSPDATKRVLREKVAELRSDLVGLDAKGRGADRTLTKAIERSLLNYEERLKKAEHALSERRDDHEFFFDQAGIDYLCVDEGHEFKNLGLTSKARNLRGVPVGPGSLKANDLDEKLRALRHRFGDRPVATMATGTPITNTVAELWVLGQYLRPDLMEELGISSFDAFRAQFTRTVSQMELDPSGTRMRRVERLAKYTNLPELARFMGEFADVVMAEDLDLPRPTLKGGKREVVVVPASPQMEIFMTEEVAKRARAIHSGTVAPEEDNMLKLCSDCRLAAFDWESFRGERVDERFAPLARAADRIAAVYALHEKHEYLTDSGLPHPRTGAFQIAFSDLGTPKSDGTSAYERFRQMLADRGIPFEKIGIVHEHDKNDEAKARFFSACRDGRYAVAITSSAKMGMGTNVQDRLVALHHLSVPWRPDIIEQRDGRGLRQGNQNEEIEVVVYAQERSFSTFGWQTVQRKAGFVGQLLRADLNGPRVLEVTDTEAIAYGEIMALSSGDETYIEAATVEDRIGRLERLQRGHGTEQAALARRERAVSSLIVTTEHRRDALAAPSRRVAACTGEPWCVEIDGRQFDNKGDAARALAPLLGRYRRAGLLVFPGSGVAVDWIVQSDGSGFFRLDVGAASITVSVERRDHEGLIGAIVRVTNQVNELPDRHALAVAELEKLTSELGRVRAKLGAPFPHVDELKDARRTLTSLRETLARRYGEEHQAPPSAPDANAGTQAEVVQISEVRRLVSAGPAHQPSVDPSAPPVEPIPINRGRPIPGHDLDR
ncbi:MAG TPA: hypothetical protein VHB02_18435 [Acidimicrobiales bacterium]|nr:hypothetical protein [Acidimicrobiales bacterium]